ncbi:MAG: hypothetical protein ACTSRP_01180 [Candidatus Helarchaeota archaeon]
MNIKKIFGKNEVELSDFYFLKENNDSFFLIGKNFFSIMHIFKINQLDKDFFSLNNWNPIKKFKIHGHSQVYQKSETYKEKLLNLKRYCWYCDEEDIFYFISLISIDIENSENTASNYIDNFLKNLNCH